MISTVIIDDEKHCSDRLSELIVRYFPTQVDLKGVADNIEEGHRLIQKEKAGLVFLDIQIGNESGFDILKRFETPPPFQVIFTTAHEQYAVKAFRFSAVDYLLKPVDIDDLGTAIQKVSQNPSVNTKVELLLANLRSMSQKGKKIAVPTERGIEFLEVEDIIRCESDINYTKIYSRNRPKLIVAKTLKDFEEILSDFNFFRVHNSHLINLSFLARYIKGKGGQAELTDGSIIEVSTRRKDEFLERITNLK